MAKLKNGIIEGTEVGGVPFSLSLIPRTNTTSRPGYFMDPKFITIHNTGNPNPGANAEMHTKFVDNTKAYVSWHFTVDDKEIFQELPINESGWHAGDGSKGDGNRASIGIEICEQEGIDWEKALENARKLVRFLLANLGDHVEVVPHQHWSGKYCPHRILDEGWEAFHTFVLQREDFMDVPEDRWSYDFIKRVIDEGLMDGYTDGTFQPESRLTREEAAVVFTRLLGRNDDLKASCEALEARAESLEAEVAAATKKATGAQEYAEMIGKEIVKRDMRISKLQKDVAALTATLEKVVTAINACKVEEEEK